MERDLSREGKGKGTNDEVRKQVSKQASSNSGEARLGKVARVSPARYVKKGYFPVPACVGLGLRLRQPRRADGRERACNHLKGPPREHERGDQRRPKEMHRLHQISARAPSSHRVDGRLRCDWPGGPMLPFTMGPILRESWSPLSLALLIIELNLDIR